MLVLSAISQCGRQTVARRFGKLKASAPIPAAARGVRIPGPLGVLVRMSCRREPFVFYGTHVTHGNGVRAGAGELRPGAKAVGWTCRTLCNGLPMPILPREPDIHPAALLEPLEHGDASGETWWA